MNKLEQEATELFGEMREATPQEQEGVKLYINQISKHKSKFDFEDIDQVQAGKQSTLVNKGKFVMLKDFPKSRPNKITHSPTMTP